MDKDLGNINFSAFLKAGLLLIIVAVVAHVGLWFVLEILERREAKLDPKPSPMFQKDQRAGGPRLQVTEAQDYRKFLDSEQEILNSYGWVNAEKGVVRIPITEAIKQVVEKEKAAAMEPAP
ncbi:MAG TPA: hypothetical protein VKE92_07585 [Anaerolineales bacterium]|nr:hypothetical protein [Anaerolineales bacterium]